MNIHAPQSRTSRAVPTLLFFLLCATGGVFSAWGQADVWVPELPQTHDYVSNARVLGMGGAYLAVSDDIAALRYNPAGLARVQRVEFSGSISDLGRDIKTTYYGTAAQSSLTRTRVSELGFVYPFPTYRGSMVIALGYAAPWPLDREYCRRGTTTGAEPRTIQEDIFEEGQIGEWSFGYAIDVSPTLSLGFRTSYIQGNRKQDWVYADPLLETDIHDVLDVDIDGFTASLGALTRLGGWGRLGLVIDLPQWITLDGTVLDAPFDETYVIDEEMTLPFSVGIGVSAAALPRLLLAADARFTDWTQIDYDGPMRYYEGDRRQLAYERVWDLHLGAEYLLDVAELPGLRLRAGFAYAPVAYRILLEDLTSDNQGYAAPVYQPADFDPDRYTVSVGLGVLIEQSMTIDVAYAHSEFAREGLNLAEDLSEQRILLSASFRLE
ncbi:MAG: hypothetical protein KAY32_01140 [Candidatus Eisenbacteria sp.]|nr:hypothetical protein [Candidatus Eisenbacteria bacterium]